MFQQKGYKVYQEPFCVYRSNMVHQVQKGIQQGDALKIFKENYLKYDVVVANMLWNPEIQLISPNIIKQFFSVDKHYQYPKEKRIMEVFTRATGNGLPFSEGSDWKRKRTILSKLFNFDFVQAQTQRIANACDEAINYLESQNGINSNNEVTYNVLNLTVRMFSSVMLFIFLGGTNNQTVGKEKASTFLNKLISDLGISSFNPVNFFLGKKILSLGLTKQQRDFERRIHLFQQWGRQFVKNRVIEIKKQLDGQKAQTETNALLKLFVIAQRKAKQNNSGQETMNSEEQIFQQFCTFFVAGTDTTANFTQMMIYQTVKNPEIEEKVRKEIEKYMKEDDYSFENLKNFVYIDNLQKETTRCFGPGTSLFTRQASVDNYLDGIPIKKGTCIETNFIINHFNEKYFKKPLQFRPQRWESQCNNLESYVFNGFSAGARACIGKQLALLQSKIAIIKFLKRYTKIKLGIENFKMTFKFLYGPEDFQSTMTIRESSKI